MKTLEILAINLRRLRDQKGISQMELATEIGVAHTSLSRWESARLMPKHDNLDAISKFYNVSISALFSEDLTSYKKADANPTLEALSELVVEQKNKIKELEGSYSQDELAIVQAYRNASKEKKVFYRATLGLSESAQQDDQKKSS